MNTFDVERKGYRFKEQLNAKLFAMDFDHKMDVSIKKGLPQYKGQNDTGWTVFVKPNTIAEALAVSQRYKRIADCYKMEAI